MNRSRFLVLLVLPLLGCGTSPEEPPKPDIDDSCLELLRSADADCNVYYEPSDPYEIYYDTYFCPGIPLSAFQQCTVLCGDVVPCNAGDQPPSLAGTYQLLPGSGQPGTLTLSDQTDTDITMAIDTIGRSPWPARVFGTSDGDFTIYAALTTVDAGSSPSAGEDTFLIIGGSVSDCQQTPWRAVKLSGTSSFEIERFDVKCSAP